MTSPTPQKPQTIDDLLSVREVAEWCRVRCDTVRGWILCGDIPAYNRGSDAFPRYFCRRADVLAKFKVVRAVVLTRKGTGAA
jgi:hypothetical protein